MGKIFRRKRKSLRRHFGWRVSLVKFFRMDLRCIETQRIAIEKRVSFCLVINTLYLLSAMKRLNQFQLNERVCRTKLLVLRARILAEGDEITSLRTQSSPRATWSRGDYLPRATLYFTLFQRSVQPLVPLCTLGLKFLNPSGLRPSHQLTQPFLREKLFQRKAGNFRLPVKPT